MSWLYPTISQVLYWGVGDIDECSIIATYWAAKAAGYEGELPTIAAFRAAAGVPDRPGPTGLMNSEVWAGIKGTSLSGMSATRLAGGTSWTTFAAQMATGGAASLALTAGLLPSKYRYGFAGGHRVGVTLQNGKWYIADPLAKKGSRPLEISEADLKRAVLGFGGGSVSGIIFQGKGFTGSAAGDAEIQPETKPNPIVPAMNVAYDRAESMGSYFRGRHERRGAAGTV